MADYTKTTNFTAKDTLPLNDPDKFIKGEEHDTEFDAIAVAIATKFDSNDFASQAQAEAEASNVVIMTPLRVANWADAGAGIVGDLHALTDPGADRIFGWDETTNTAIGFTLGSGLAFNGTAIDASILGLEDLTDPGADRIFFWDDGGSASGFLEANIGLTISGTQLNVDPSGLTETGISSLDQAQDGYLISNNGVAEVMPYDESGVKVVNASDSDQTFALTDANTIQVIDSTTTRTWTIPPNSSVAFEIGSVIIVQSINTAGVTITAGTGVVLTSVFNTASTTATSDSCDAGGRVILIKVAADEWVASGDLSD